MCGPTYPDCSPSQSGRHERPVLGRLGADITRPRATGLGDEVQDVMPNVGQSTSDSKYFQRCILRSVVGAGQTAVASKCGPCMRREWTPGTETVGWTVSASAHH